MALEIAPAPAKATPTKPAAQTASARTDSVDRAAKSASQGKKDQAADPAGFLALLMGLGQEPAPDASADPTALDSDTTELDAKDVKTDLTTPLPEAVVLPTTVADTTSLPAVALPELRRSQGQTDDKAIESTDALASTALDKVASGGRRRSSSLADTLGTMGTQQLQTDTPKESSSKMAELAPTRDAKTAAPASRLEMQPIQIPASLQAPIASEEARKANHAGQAKVEVADNLIVLSSGLSGAMSAAGVPDVGPSGSAAQFQSVVAQEVAYYVSQDVQSAEMKLEGVGGGPVEVSINMQGQEAQVVFRTDELQTREMLEGATAQLKDMLQQQGVTLTGVFVGGSGAGDAGQQQERRFRQGSRSETTLRIATPEVRGPGVSAAGVGRTLDLYV